MEALLAELDEWLRIPSVSTGDADLAAIRRASEWACERIVAAGGTAEVLDGFGHPLGVGELRARVKDAPTVLVYGHVDVQSAGPEEAWTSPPFDPHVRDGRIYARGASDDKGNVLPLLHVACALAGAGELPVNVRFLLDGEEESFGSGAGRWLTETMEHAPVDCALVFDGEMLDERTPTICASLRGIVKIDLTVRTAETDLHSGVYGGCALNAASVLHRVLAAVLPDASGQLREELRAGVAAPLEDDDLPPAPQLPHGVAVLADAAARPIGPGVADEYYARTWLQPALDVNALAGGEPRTILPAVAQATISQRLAPGQSAATIAATLERLLHDALPDGADLSLSCVACDPAVFSPHTPALQLCAQSLTHVVGADALFTRSGGTIPIMATLSSLGIPAALTGFALPSDGVHGPDESYRLDALRLGVRAARDLYATLARLPREVAC